MKMEDDDLEVLRLAALKSLQRKTENKQKIGNAIKVVESTTANNNSSYFPAAKHPHVQTISRIETLVHTNNDNLLTNDTFIKQRHDVMPPWIESDYASYNSSQSRGILPNVQLSPRSAAFVSQNNDILNRRKVSRTPDRDRSRSPIIPYRYSPGKWSASPPPYSNSRSNFIHRSNSRSPMRRDTSITRRSSPALHSKSPPSRSPIPPKFRKSPLSGSPHRSNNNERHTSPNYNRHRSPSARHMNSNKSYKRYSPSYNRSFNRKLANSKRSPSPRTSNNGHHLRRSRSPAINAKRSRSKSPNRNVSGRLGRGEHSSKRRSPYHQKINRQTNRSRRKSLTLSNNRRSPSTSKRKIEKIQKTECNEKVDDLSQSGNDERKENSEAMEIGKYVSEADNTKLTDDAIATDVTGEKEKQKNNTENESIASSESSDENEDDGIDLFASEESESENEGRFKSNSNKSVKSNTVATVSFSKLGSSATSALGDLSELKTDTMSSQRDRTDDRYKRRSNYSSRRDDRNSKKYADNRYNDSRNSYKPKYSSSTSSVQPKSTDDKKRDDKNMFKSTFQVLSNEIKSEAVPKLAVSSKVSPVNEKSNDKKTVVLKRSVEQSNEDQIEEELTINGDNGTKKPVHLRLGAPTKSWKNKKSWRTEKV